MDLVERLKQRKKERVVVLPKHLGATSVSDEEKAHLISDLLFTMTIGSMTALPRIPANRVIELYREIKRVYQL